MTSLAPRSSRRASAFPAIPLVLGIAVGLLGHDLLLGESGPPGPPSDGQRTARDELAGARVWSEAAAEAGTPAESASAPPSRRDVEAVPEVGSDTVVVHGSVLSRDGSPVPASFVRFTPVDESSKPRSVRCDPEHPYAIAGLTSGSWRVSCKPKKFRKFETTITLGSEPSVHLDLVLDPAAMITVRLVDHEGAAILDLLSQRNGQSFGISLESVTVVATEGPLSADLPLTTSRAVFRTDAAIFRAARSMFSDGSESVAPEVLGHVELLDQRARHFHLVNRHVRIQTQLLPGGTDEVTFTLAPEDIETSFASLSLRLIDAVTELPIPSISVRLANRQGHAAAGRSDDDGYVTIPHCQAGPLQLEIHVPDRAHIREQVFLHPGTNDWNAIRVPSAHEFTLEVLGPDGEPRSGTLRAVRDPEHVLQRLSSGFGYRIPPSGVSPIPQLRPGPHAAYVERDDDTESLIGSFAFDVPPVDDSPIVVRLSPAGMVRVVLGADTPRALYIVSVLSASGQLIRWETLRGLERTFRAPVGSYRIEVHRLDVDGQTRFVTSENVTIGISGETSIEIH